MGTNRRILVIGAGGREHALALRLLESESVGEVIVCPGNPGTETAPPELAARGKVMRNVEGDPIAVATAGEVELAVIGPEAPLCAGLADRLAERGVLCFGPTELAARLEGSKEFMKSFAERHGIRTARHVVVHDPSSLEAALARFEEPPVVKADGLCAGKGVVVARDFDEAREAALGMLVGQRFGAAGTTLVLEERLVGFETSVHAICDGERLVVLPPAQDHKRLMDGDRGPNTGGMGTFAPTPRVSGELMEIIERDILARAVAGMARDGCPFRGCLFAGLMVSAQGEPVLLEFNVRFGDPETQVLMGLIDGDLGEILGAAAEGRLTERLTVRPAHALCVVLAAAGYPESPRKGEVISGLAEASAVAGVRVYHAGTRRERERVVTAGGRVLGVTAVADSMKLARERAYQAVGVLEFAGKQCRGDIGLSVLHEARGAS